MINLLLLALIACGSDEETDTSKEAEVEETQEEVTEEQEESSEEVPAQEGTQE